MTEFQINRLPGESEEEFIWRLGTAKDAGALDMDWGGIADIVNREFRYDESEYRNESAYRKPYQQAKRFYEAGVFKELTSEAYVAIIRAEQEELRREKMKVQSEKLEYSRWLREHARDELIAEKLVNAIRELQTIESVTPIRTEGADPCAPRDKVGILCYGDEHYGAEFEIKGLWGETINAYSPEIFELRMNMLLQAAIAKGKSLGLTSLRVYSLGDEIDGILRASQLMKLRYGVVESTIRYAEFICQWLNELSKYFHIYFHMTEGNHSELRMISQPKGTFTDDNMSRVIKQFIKVRLEDNENFTLVENDTGLIFDQVFGFDILGVHGEVKNMSAALKNFSTIYDTNVDILIGGHKHHAQSETVGIGKDVVNVPSMIGVDHFSMKIGKTSDAGALFLVLENGKGIVEQHYIRF